jgi:hypothetical protein
LPQALQDSIVEQDEHKAPVLDVPLASQLDPLSAVDILALLGSTNSVLLFVEPLPGTVVVDFRPALEAFGLARLVTGGVYDSYDLFGILSSWGVDEAHQATPVSSARNDGHFRPALEAFGLARLVTGGVYDSFGVSLDLSRNIMRP